MLKPGVGALRCVLGSASRLKYVTLILDIKLKIFIYTVKV